MKQAIHALIRTLFGTRRTAPVALASAMRPVSREELRSVVGGATSELPKGTWLTTPELPKGTW